MKIIRNWLHQMWVTLSNHLFLIAIWNYLDGIQIYIFVASSPFWRLAFSLDLLALGHFFENMLIYHPWDPWRLAFTLDPAVPMKYALFHNNEWNSHHQFKKQPLASQLTSLFTLTLDILLILVLLDFWRTSVSISFNFRFFHV